jgi:putative tricarboxylic transport membrane protein
MHNSDTTEDERSLVSNRTLDIVVALLFIGACAVVIYDSLRLGVGWIEGQGPAPGYFPFWVAVTMAIASVVNLVRAVLGKEKGGGESFISVVGFGRVMSVLFPTTLYVAAIGGLNVGGFEINGLGIYVASAIFIFLFTIIFGREKILRALAVSIGVPLALFFMFEKWFLVPLPKGPLEVMLGVG